VYRIVDHSGPVAGRRGSCRTLQVPVLRQQGSGDRKVRQQQCFRCAQDYPPPNYSVDSRENLRCPNQAPENEIFHYRAGSVCCLCGRRRGVYFCGRRKDSTARRDIHVSGILGKAIVLSKGRAILGHYVPKCGEDWLSRRPVGRDGACRKLGRPIPNRLQDAILPHWALRPDLVMPGIPAKPLPLLTARKKSSGGKNTLATCKHHEISRLLNPLVQPKS
jgi:hypothetical protein